MVIQARGVTLIKDRTPLIKNLDWTVQPGEHWAVLGLNGSGKTTLLDIINGYQFPTEGEITVLGKTFGQYDLRELRKSIGWVSTALQERLYGKEPVIEVVLSGKFASIGLYDAISETDREEAMKILQDLKIQSLADRRYRTLSQGEKQRVIIGRALMARPRILILDEPCGGLDIFARESLLKTIEALGKERNAPTLIYVTHHVEEILPVFSHTLLIREGEVFASGRTPEIMTQEKLTGFFKAPVRLSHNKARYTLQPEY